MTEQARIQQLFDLLAQAYPDPTTELNYETPFQLLVAVVLSAQSTDKGVNKVTERFFATVKNAEDLKQLSLSTVEHSIKSLGLFKSKARYLKELADQLIEHFDGIVPDNLASLMSLSGVGRKTANVILNTLYHHDVIAVDTHVLRVSQRLGLSKEKTPLAVEYDLMQAIPPLALKNAHHHLILHGRYTCKARRPVCETCCIQHLCPFFVKTQTNP